MTTQQVCKQHLRDRILKIGNLLDEACNLLDEDEFLQCAVRIEEAGKLGKFDTLLMNVFDSLSSSGKEGISD